MMKLHPYGAWHMTLTEPLKALWGFLRWWLREEIAYLCYRCGCDPLDPRD